MACLATSQLKYRKSPGCQRKASLFFIEAKRDWFDLDTWLQLYEIYEFPASYLLRLKLASGVLEIRGRLRQQTIRKIVNCIKVLDDVSIYHKRLIAKS